MKLYNSLSRSLQEFRPISDKNVMLYTCGPTVYDHVHIGNLRTYVFEDTLRRTLRAAGYDVKHVMNITDVDDKTIERSHEKFPDEEPMAALKKLTDRYEQIFLDDARRVGIDFSNSRIAKATEHIEDMRHLINDIPNKYLSDDGVYYDIGKDPDYGVLVKLNRSHEHHRIDNDEYDKEHVADFALWKKQTEGEPAWDFEIDGRKMPGRPGWHIECSAMSTRYLGQPFDIHTGGADLMFPHHENEIAQSRAASGKELAKFFVHAEHLLVDGRKMSKSLNNFYTLEDIKAKGFDPLALRLLFLQAHYRTQLNFTWESLAAAAQNLTGLRAWADLAHQTDLMPEINATQSSRLEAEIKAALDDDLNTARALAQINESVDKVSPTGELLNLLDDYLGLELSKRKDIDDELKKLIAEREDARKAEDWVKADELRNKLKAEGIELNDTEHGPVWSRV